jgi:MFS family permease
MLANRELRWILFVFGIFGFANISYSFLLLAANRVGWPTPTLPLLYFVFTFLAALSSTPFGRIADHFGSRTIMLFSFGLLGVTFLIAGISTSAIGILPAFILYGLHKGALEPSERMLVASLAPPEQRATILGTAQFTLGMTAIPASLFAGFLWDLTHGPFLPFLFAIGLLVLASFFLFLLRPTLGNQTAHSSQN